MMTTLTNGSLQPTGRVSATSEFEVSSRLPVNRIAQFLDDSAVLIDDLMTSENDNHITGNDYDSPLFENIITISNLPPLDQITICSESSSSDNTSNFDVSSVTTDENDEMTQFFTTTSTPKESLSYPTPMLRTIFHRYWEKNRSLQVTTTLESKVLPLPMSPLSNDGETCSINTYERSLLQNQVKMNEQQVTPPSSRRCIFQGLPSTTDLVVDNNVLRYPNKAHSDSCLLTKKAKPPCLRRSRFSVSSSSSSSQPAATTPTPQKHGRQTSSTVESVLTSSSTTVTFNPNIDIVIYRRPVELFAAKGWSDYFTS